MTTPEIVMLTRAEYERLLEAAEHDEMIVICEVCGAWMDINEPACATTDDFTGCWKVATRREQDSHLCVSHRAAPPEADPSKRRGAAKPRQGSRQ